jgi:hypothetical protein
MRLIKKLTKKPTRMEVEVGEIRARVQEMRAAIEQRDVDLADLFAMVGEDERPVLRATLEVKRADVERIWPDEVPSLAPGHPDADAKVTYGDWELIRRPGPFTVP